MASTKRASKVAPTAATSKAGVRKTRKGTSRKGKGHNTRLSKPITTDLHQVWGRIIKLSEEDRKKEYDRESKIIIEKYNITGAKELRAVKKFFSSEKYRLKRREKKAENAKEGVAADVTEAQKEVAKFTVAAKTKKEVAKPAAASVANEIAVLHKNIHAIQTGLDTTRKKVGALETGLNNAHKKVGTLQTGLGKAQEKIDTLQTELEECQEKVDALMELQG